MKYGLMIFFLAVSTLAIAQEENKGWELGARAGISYYFGDLNTNFDITHPGIAFGGGARYNFNNRIAIGAMLNASRIYYRDSYSDNIFQQARNLSFRTDIAELEARVEFNFLEYIHGDFNYGSTPYLHAGFSVHYFVPTAEYQGERHALRPLGTEGQFPGNEYFWIKPAFNYGVGMKVDMSYRWSFQVDLSARVLFHDYIDDVSGTYPGEQELRSIRGTELDLSIALSDRSVETEEFPEIGQAGRQRGNGRNNDSFAYLTTGFYYYFGKLRCPKISPLY